MKVLGWLLIFLAGGLLPAAVAAEEAGKYLGVASCATGVCHGKTVAQVDNAVRLNEYATWSQNYHARAYRTLANDASRVMAANLGIGNAQTADICLDCHATNVATELRAEKFQISDGVSCEACHGPASGWIDSHDDSDVTHQDNIDRGLIATEDPVVRAQMCLSCHLGTEDQYTTHLIMGAGHPRLTFELDWFSTNQPPHYDIDADYRERKSAADGYQLWLAGQVEAARAYLKLVAHHMEQPGMIPELALYDCHSCHHPMEQQRWSRTNRARGIEPGSLRLQEQHFLMLQAATEVIDPDSARELRRLTDALVLEGQRDAAAARSAALQLSNWLEDRAGSWTQREAQAGRVRRALVRAGSEGRYVDYVAAEQMVLSVESLSLYMGDAERLSDTLDDLFNALGGNADYSPTRFRDASRRALGAFGT